MAEVMKTNNNYGDVGSCVLGMELEFHGRTVASQIAQGSSSNYKFFEDIKKAASICGIDESAFTIKHGNMD